MTSVFSRLGAVPPAHAFLPSQSARESFNHLAELTQHDPRP